MDRLQKEQEKAKRERIKEDNRRKREEKKKDRMDYNDFRYLF